MAKFIKFKDSGDRHHARPVYDILNKRSYDCIGMVFWYPEWKLWAVRFKEDSVWSAGCLRDVQEFIEGLPK
jgi:hypothetical protein